MRLFCRTPGADQANTDPVQISAGFGSDGSQNTWRVVWAGTNTQIINFTVPGNWTRVERSSEGNRQILTAFYEVKDGQAITSTTHTGEHVSEHWSVNTETVEKLFLEHPTILPEGYDTSDSALSYKLVSKEQRELLAALFESYPRPRWDDVWDRETGEIGVTGGTTVSAQFTAAKDSGDSGNSGEAACKKIYFKFLQTNRKTYSYREYVITRAIRYNRAYTGHSSGIDPGDVLKQVNCFADTITDFASVSGTPTRIGETLTNLQKDNSLPDLGYDSTATHRSLLYFVKTGANFDEMSDGTVDIFESWRLQHDPDPDILLEI